ncbi:MAG: PucR family transcriptional regulator [Frankiales bacterium]|nr:MAG: PucR family transcriptional regulator [Frankiales bacterium]
MAAGLYVRVQRVLPVLARRMIATFLEEIPLYALLPREQLEGEVLAICEDNLRTFFATLIEDRAPTEEELSEPRASAARRAQERVPLAAVLTAYHVGGRIGWAELVAQARPDEMPELLAAADRVQLYVQAVTAVVATAYLQEQQAISGEEGDVLRALVAALLAGEPAEELAERLGRKLPTRWVVLALDLGAHPDEERSEAVAARRKVRRVQAVLDEHVGEPVLAQLHASGGIVLLPDDGRPLSQLVAGLQDAAGAPLRAGAAHAGTTADVCEAAAQAREVLRLAGAEPGLYVLRDVLLDYQLSRPSDAQQQLAALLDPLERFPDLLRTLEAYLDQDLDRRRTAAALHVHPNTLDYRLKRVVELTGLEPATTKGLQLLAGAVAVRRLGG